MTHLNPHKVGLTFGALLGLWHAMWSLLVALGVAQTLLNFILGLHFLNVSFSVNEFQIGTALTLVAITSVIGYVMGYIGGAVWNRLTK